MATEEPSGLLRLKRTDDGDSVVVVLIYSRGHNALDLELVASEGLSAWAVTIKESQAKTLKATSNQVSDPVWEASLRAALLLEKPPNHLAAELEGLEVVWTITQDGHMSLIFRRNIGELTQRLGTLELGPTGDDRFDLWAGCAAGAKLIADSRKHANDLEDKLASQEESNRKLQRQLEELVQAKEEHEDALFHKFAELINAKKLKIRDQQRLLATAKVDPDEVEKSQTGNTSRTPGASRDSKRKAAANHPASDDSSDGFDDVQDEDEPMQDASTPDPLEDPDDTDDEDEDEDDAVPDPLPEPQKGIRRTLASKVHDSEPTTAKSTSGEQKASQEPPKDKELPPRRELPFARRKAARDAEQKMSQGAAPAGPPSTSTAVNANADDDTTDDDDEL